VYIFDPVNQNKPNKMKITKVYAGKYQMCIEGLPLPLFVSRRLNEHCAPTNDWNLFYGDNLGREWIDTLSSKKDCIDLIKRMVQEGSIKYYCGIEDKLKA
jgi:hypothetical protein